MSHRRTNSEKQALLRSDERLLDTSSSSIWFYRTTSKIIPSLVIRQKVDADFYHRICNKLLSDAEDNDGLDIYQVTAFVHRESHDNISSTFNYLFYCLKSCVCFLIQTVGMVLYLYNLIMTQPNSILLCTPKQPTELTILAILFSMYISLQMMSTVKETQRDGLYENVAYSPPFIVGWVYIGLYTNFFTLKILVNSSDIDEYNK